jgi:geranylgeranyl pyrophosphate synthase
MEMSTETGGPYSFSVADLPQERLRVGIEHTLQDFEQWRDANPEIIAEHVDTLTDRLQEVSDGHSLRRKLGRLVLPGARKKFNDQKEKEYIHFFGVHNLGAHLDDSSMDFFQTRIRKGWELASSKAIKNQASVDYMGTMLGAIEGVFPDIKATGLMPWLKERVLHLHSILPEEVVKAGTTGNVLRVALGVMAIASHDVMDEPLHIQTEHMQRVIPGAYVYGASYALIDEVMQSAAGSAIPKEHKDRYHRGILQGLATGGSIDTSRLPDHPLAEELESMYHLLQYHYPIKEYPYLYDAAESMYLAQDRDAHLDPETIARAGGIRGMYPDMVAKAAMTRVVADLLGRRSVADVNLSFFINENFGGQLRDDLEDHSLDRQLGNWTPFTVPYDRETESTNPLYDLFAYDAYIVHRLCRQDPVTRAAYIRFSAGETGCCLAKNPEYAAALLRTYPCTEEIARFIRTASAISPSRAELIDPDDIRLLTRTMDALSVREQTAVDPRTFVTDRLEYINDAISAAVPRNELLSDAAHYALEAGGKRLRPALTLMLAEGLGVSPQRVTPLLQSIELFHTSSLVFDDLPAQDNATLRRGKPPTHIQFNEWNAQLAGISMISRGFGVLADLNQYFPAENVNKVVEYAGYVMGLEGLCRGQAMDLILEENGLEATVDDIIDMYHHKTSLAIEASLVPLMLLLDKSEGEIDLIKDFAHHAGIVFQIKDDILDLTATPEGIGKDTENDINKLNVVRLCGLEEAQRLMEDNLAIAIDTCRQLPFNTDLLVGTVRHFATRKK